MQKDVCIIGVFRCGTNFAKSVLDSAFGISASFSTVFWKHQIYPTLSRARSGPTTFVIIVKDPLHQLVSWFHYARASPLSMQGQTKFDDFIRSPITISVNRNTHPVYFFPTPMTYWNQYYFTCAALTASKPETHIMIRYEDLLADTGGCIARLSAILDLPPVTDRPLLPKMKMQNLAGNKKFDPALHTRKTEFNHASVERKDYLNFYTDTGRTWVQDSVLDELRPLYPNLGYLQSHPARMPEAGGT